MENSNPPEGYSKAKNEGRYQNQNRNPLRPVTFSRSKRMFTRIKFVAFGVGMYAFMNWVDFFRSNYK